MSTIRHLYRSCNERLLIYLQIKKTAFAGFFVTSLSYYLVLRIAAMSRDFFRSAVFALIIPRFAALSIAL